MSRKGFAVAVAMLSVTSAAYSLVLSLVNPALDTLRQALHADQFGISWVLTSCLLSSAVLTPGSVVAALPRGLPVLAVGRVRFETLNQAVNGDLVIAGQAHGLALPGKLRAAGWWTCFCAQSRSSRYSLFWSLPALAF